MGQIIYWNKFDEPKKFKEKINSKVYKRELTGEWICKDDRVDKVWFHGGLSTKEGDNEIGMWASFIFKDGSRHEKKINLQDNIRKDYIEQQSEEFLQSIK